VNVTQLDDNGEPKAARWRRFDHQHQRFNRADRRHDASRQRERFHFRGYLIMTDKLKQAVARAMKGLRFQVKSADEGTVEAVFATFNVKDLDGDVTLPGAFEDGAEVLISAYNHGTWGCALPVGKGVIHADKNEGVARRSVLPRHAGRPETFKTVKNTGDLQEWSYGYKVLETGEVTDEMYQNGVWRVIKKVKVWEVSPVMVGAGIGTETLSVKSAKDEPTPESIEADRVATAAAAATKAAQRRDAGEGAEGVRAVLDDARAPQHGARCRSLSRSFGRRQRSRIPLSSMLAVLGESDGPMELVGVVRESDLVQAIAKPRARVAVSLSVDECLPPYCESVISVLR
jgi:HK97 family phage prohead protease